MCGAQRHPTVRDGLAMAYQVIVRPNSAFAALRDHDRRYFPLSIAVLLLSSIQYAGFASLAPAMNVQEQITSAASGFGLTILGMATTASIIYLVGRALGGNKNWRAVFTAIFYTGIIWVPVSALGSLLSPLLSDATSVGLQAMAAIMMAAALAWMVIILVKAIKVLNGFGTAKAFGIMILSGIAQMIWIVPVVLFYLWTAPLGMPDWQTLP